MRQSYVIGLVTLWMASATAQEGPGAAPQVPTATFQVGEASLREVKAAFDPFAGAIVRGVDQTGRTRTLELRWPPLDWPLPGEHVGGDRPTILLDGQAAQGTLHLEACAPGGLRGRAELRPADAPPVPVAFAVVPDLAAAQVLGAPAMPSERVPAESPADPGDIEFAVLGNGGTGWPGQHRVAAGLQRLATPGRFDFVLLLGDQFMPRGVQSIGDPRWRHCFEDVYPAATLPMPFHAVTGDRDLRGKELPLHEYATLNARWNSRTLVYQFEARSHGRRVGFFGLDTQLYSEDIGHPSMRFSRRLLGEALTKSDAHVKVVFGHLPLESLTGESDAKRTASLSAVARNLWTQWGVDLYLCAGDHCLAFVQGEGLPPQVTSGAAAGPDLSRSPTWSPTTSFAATGGGFATLRFDGRQFTITFRDSDGAPLAVRTVEPRRKG